LTRSFRGHAPRNTTACTRVGAAHETPPPLTSGTWRGVAGGEKLVVRRTTNPLEDRCTVREVVAIGWPGPISEELGNHCAEASRRGGAMTASLPWVCHDDMRMSLIYDRS
jgi:hypothetical protein